ncbi:MAG: hypothetical protein B7Z52_01770 [Burkholderiales bacterium 12-64-5]|nr:MAG: hypothetical protein B7Z52_01770 [Burkholderiales bacterium 12-64-5]
MLQHSIRHANALGAKTLRPMKEPQRQRTMQCNSRHRSPPLSGRWPAPCGCAASEGLRAADDQQLEETQCL